MLRAFAERLSRGRSFVYRLPANYGGCRMYLTPEAGLRYWFPQRGIVGDKALLDNAAEFVKTGCVVWDVGANMGLFSFAAAGLAGPTGKVFAIEPDAVMARLMRRSARLNPDSAPVEVIPCAVAETNGLAHFQIAERSRTSNALDGFMLSQSGGVRESETVVTVSLDWLATQVPAPDVLKIDVEGAELLVLRGAEQLLREKQPVVLFKLTRKNWAEESKLLSAIGYTLYDSEAAPGERVQLVEARCNILAVPQHVNAATNTESPRTA